MALKRIKSIKINLIFFPLKVLKESKRFRARFSRRYRLLANLVISLNIFVFFFFLAFK